jgi:hypothetical protein
MLKEHQEFFTIDLTSGWEALGDRYQGIEQKILSGHLEEKKRIGCRTRLLLFQPGAFTTEPFEHDYWEEVFQVSGDMTAGGEKFGPMTYACRPPHLPHGPFRSESGCMLYEIHYFEASIGREP